MNETELLFTEVLNCERSSLYLNKALPLSKDKSAFISLALKRRIYGEPIQYILGKAEFMGLEFKVTPDVFIPRPETEVLIETAIKYANRLSPIANRILDLGAGSGCIAISLAKLLPHVEITALDISAKALEIAMANAKLNKVKVNFIQGDLFNPYHLTLPPEADPPAAGNLYHLIVSNPPYIPSAEIQGLQPEIGYEPRLALDGGSDGLDFYRRIINSAPDYLKEGGFLILEMGFGQRRKIENIFKKSEKFEIIENIKDYSGIDRVIVARKHG